MCVGGRGGDFILERLCPCCKIHRGDYVRVSKFRAKMSGGILSGRDIPFFGCCCELVFSQFYTILVIMSAQCGSRPRRIEHAQSAQIYAPTKASIKEF